MSACRIILSALLAFLMPAALVGATPQPNDAHVPNSSFEEQGETGKSPRGWELHGSSDAPEGAWIKEMPFDGNRAVRIDASRGSSNWQSNSFELPAHREYMLTWQTRFHGEKEWRFRASFCGAEVILQDAHGQMVHSVRTHSHSWQTPGWQPAWLHVSIPNEAKSMVLRFGIETDESLPGGFDVDSVKLIRWPQVSTDSKQLNLNLRIHNENGFPTAARVRAVSSKGSAVRPEASISYQIGRAFHPFDEGSCQLVIPPETYTITVTKGFEYWPWEKSLRVGPEDTQLKIDLQRAWSWDRRGWYGGDHHTHLHRHGGSLYPMLTWRDVMRAARCEGLSFLPFMGTDRYPVDNATQAVELQRSDFVAELRDEITEDFWGHVCPIGVPPERLVDPAFEHGPMNFDRDAAIGDRGMLCYAHPYGPLTDDDGLIAVSQLRRGHVARKFPIDLALGMRCGIDLLTMEGERNQLERKLKDVYRLYNLGFRPALTASTDFHVDQARQPIGAVRTYFRCRELRMSAIAAAYRAGRTFATNGPLIDLKVADAAPGDEIAVADRRRLLPVSVEAVSIGRLQRVEIIVNGRLVHTLTATEPHRITGKFSLPASESLWVAARVVGLENPHLAAELEGRKLGAGQFAHTSPVYVLVDGGPILAAQKEDALYFARWCDAALQAWAIHLLEFPSTAKDDQLVRQRIDRAKAVYLELASRL